MAKRGRKPLGWKPETDERKEWLARDFLNLIQKYYLQMMDYDKGKNIIDWDIFNDTLLLTHRTIKYNGVDSPVYVTQDTPEEERYRIYRYKVFTSYQINLGSIKGRQPIMEQLPDTYTPEDNPTIKKIEKDTKQDAKTMAVLELAEQMAEPITFYCFRIYYLIPGMSYTKLKQITKVSDCKKRVVGLRKQLQENIALLNAATDKKMSEKGF